MDFYAVLAQVSELLQREGRVSYRALKVQFSLDDDQLEALKDELIEAKRLAIDERGRVLVWVGEALPAEPPTMHPSPVAPLPGAQPDHLIQSAPLAATPHAPEAERRQLTVMFCDLVDSTSLAQRLDPEDYRAVVRAYQEAAVGAIQPFDGYVAQYLGDGLLVYFGYPQAHEDAAQRAVRAGLAIVDAMTPLNTRLEPQYGVRVAVRLGLHTGVAVVGSVGSGARQEQLAMGDTPNIAARLQGLAAPNTVVLSAVTTRLLHSAFALEDVGVHQLKGVAEPMAVCRVFGLGEPASDEAEPAPARLPFLVGREEELGLLLRRWEQSKAGLGQVVLLSGEAGIGKTALVEKLRAHVAREGYTRVGFRGSPYHTHSALYPVIEHVKRVLRLDHHDSPETTLDKLEQALQGSRLPAEEVIPLLAALLSVPLPEGRYPALTLTPQQQRQQTLDALVAWLVVEAERRPVLAVYEDVHWVDPSTLELLGMLVEQAPTVPMLHVLAFRPDFVPPWPPRAHITPLTLNRLDRPQVEALIRHLAGGKALPAEVVQHIVTRTDGVPLFIEELTRMLLESGLLREDRDALCPHGAPGERPDSRHAARCLNGPPGSPAGGESRGPTGGGAGPGVFICCAPGPRASGRSHPPGAAGAVGGGGVALSTGPATACHLMFKHALIQDAAYASLLKSTRQQVHRQVAEVLEDSSPRRWPRSRNSWRSTTPRPGSRSRPFPTGSGPGSRPAQRSANPEAVQHLTTGLELLATLPETPAAGSAGAGPADCPGTGFDGHQGLCGPRGGADLRPGAGVVRAGRRDAPALSDAAGLMSVLSSRGALPTAQELGEQLYRLAQRAADTDAPPGGP